MSSAATEAAAQTVLDGLSPDVRAALLRITSSGIQPRPATNADEEELDPVRPRALGSVHSSQSRCTGITTLPPANQYRVPELKANGWALWKTSFIILLKTWDLYDTIQTPIRGLRTDGFEDGSTLDELLAIRTLGTPQYTALLKSKDVHMLIMEAVLKLDDPASRIVQVETGNGHEAWRALTECYEDTSAAATAAMFGKLFTLKQKSEETVLQYTNELRTLANELHRRGQKVPPLLLVEVMTKGLRSEFATNIAAFQAMGGGTFETLVSIAKAADLACPKAQKIPQISAAAAFTKSNGPFTGTCFNCGQKGHRGADCRNPKVELPRCGWCRKTNHTEDECRTKKAQREKLQVEGKSAIVKGAD